jgi:hypothetical protein
MISRGASADEQRARVRDQRAEHAITHMKRHQARPRGPDLVISDTARACSAVRELVEAKTCAFCPGAGNCGTRLAISGNTSGWKPERTRRSSSRAAAVLDDFQMPCVGAQWWGGGEGQKEEEAQVAGAAAAAAAVSAAQGQQ